MIASALVALTLGYWGPNHGQMHEDVMMRGQPFRFSRQGNEVRSFNAYLERVLYLSNGRRKPIKGVQFKEASINPGTDTPDDAPNRTLEAEDWVKWGGVWEDGFNNSDEATKWGGLRAVNHFHDPLNPIEGGYQGIRTANGIIVTPLPLATGIPYLDLIRNGKSVTSWVMGEGGGGQKNAWGYPAVVNGFRKFFTDPDPEKRASGMAAVLRSVGHVMHLVQDNTVPDHARNLAHPGNGWEEFMRDRKALFNPTPLPWRVMPLQKIEEDGLRALWDRDVYSGVTPAPTVSDPVGIDEFVQANFLAYNRFYSSQAVLGIKNPLERPIEFTTVPEKPGTGYKGVYPWPKLSEPADDAFQSVSPALSLPTCIAREGNLLLDNYVDERCWDGWASPLMKIAHGYSQTVLTLAFPQGRAELVPADGKDLRKWKLRVWNLTQDEDKVTWHVDSVKVAPILPKALGKSKAAVVLPGVSGDIAPTLGQPWESPVFQLSIQEQSSLNFMSHSVVVLEGNLGTQKKTPFVYGLPIPNGLPLVMQETTHIDTAEPDTIATTNTTACCNPMQCTSCGENTEVRQPLVQQVKGRIKMMPSEVDLLGDPASDGVKAAQRNDARIAGFAVIAYTNFNQPYYAPIQPPSLQLKVGQDAATRFTCTNSVCLRNPDAPDTEDVEITYDFTLKLKEVMDPSNPPSATDSVYVMVWSTSGAIIEWPVLLWPMYMNRTSSQVIADNGGECGHALGRGLPGAEVAGGCYSAARQPSCGNAKHTTWTRQTVMGPIVGLAARLADKDFFSIPGLPRVLQLAGQPPIASGTQCDPPVSSLGNANIVCVSNGNSFIIKSMVDLDQSGACPSIPAKPALNYTAKYEGAVGPDATMYYLKVFGTKSYPKWVTDLD